MKKFICFILVVIFALSTVACANTTTETREVEAIVIKCEKGVFMPHEEYLAKANICLAFKKPEAYAYYKELADANGSWQYNVTVQFEGEEYTISRMEAFDAGVMIPVTVTITYRGEDIAYIKCE